MNKGYRYFSTNINPEDPRPEKRLQFSAFARKERDYTPEDRILRQKKEQVIPETFFPKQEFTRMPFDPNVRMRHDEMDNYMILRNLQGYVEDYEPQSNYVAITFKGNTWHLFNAARFPLGRMA